MPNIISLTQAAADRIRPTDKRVIYWDKHCPAFGLRVAPTGAKSWICVFRPKGSTTQIWHTLGPLHLIPKVEEARETARSILLEARKGIAPTHTRKEKKEAAAVAAALVEQHRFDTVVATYLKSYVDVKFRPRWAKECRRILEKDAIPAFGARDIKSITDDDITHLLANLMERGPSAALHLHVALKGFFNWASDKKHIPKELNPVTHLKPPSERKDRDRFLDDREIVTFWNGCNKLGGPYGPMCQFLLLTAQRRGEEVGGMLWPEINWDERIWTIPGSRTKNKKAHDVHLSAQAIKLLRSLPRYDSNGLVFTTISGKPLSGWSRAKRELDKHAPLDHYTFHDLRRTATTVMARIGIKHEVADKLLNHSGGKISGVAAIYQRYDFAEERRNAFERFGNHIETLINPVPGGKVVALATARG